MPPHVLADGADAEALVQLRVNKPPFVLAEGSVPCVLPPGHLDHRGLLVGRANVLRDGVRLPSEGRADLRPRCALGAHVAGLRELAGTPVAVGVLRYDLRRHGNLH